MDSKFKNYCNLQDALERRPDGNPYSLAHFVDKMTTKKLDKRETILNWENFELRDAQKMYAALDAYILIELAEHYYEIN